MTEKTKGMILLAPLPWFTILVLRVFCQSFHEDCQSKYNDSTPIAFFKEQFEAKFREIEISETQPSIDKEMISLRDYFLGSSCGDMAVEPEAAIVNGSDAPDKAWPWQTLIYTDKEICGGILISDRWVLSAAHCFYPPTKGQIFYVELGMRIMGPVRGESVFTRVAKVIVLHERYSKVEIKYDIALVKLDSRVSFSERVKPACLPLHRTVFNESNVCYISGFGTGAPNLDDHRTLQQLKVLVLPMKECFYLWSYLSKAQVDKRRMCVQAMKKAGTCSGDSGGPLSCKDGSKYYVAGIANYALTTCMADVIPAVYAQVSAYLNWIFDVINKYKL